MNEMGRMRMRYENTLSASPVTRRDFFKTAAAGAGALLAAGAFPLTGDAAPPIKRNGKPHMKLSLAAYSFRKYLLRIGVDAGTEIVAVAALHVLAADLPLVGHGVPLASPAWRHRAT